MRSFITLLALALLALPAMAQANTLGFGDGTIIWPDHPSGNTQENSQDTIGTNNLTGNGTPQISGGEIDLSNTGAVQAVRFDYTVKSKKLFDDLYNGKGSVVRPLQPGDLFFDVDADLTWDYFVDVNNAAGIDQPFANGQTFNIYEVVTPIAIGSASDALYEFSFGQTPNPFPDGEPNNVRCDHPVQILDPSDANFFALVDGPTVTVNGWSRGGGTLEFIFDGVPFNLAADQMMNIGFTVSCANDVILEKITAPTTITQPIPLPAAVWLLGGALGFLGLRKRR